MNQCSVKFTVTVIKTSTGWPFSLVGVNFHCWTAHDADIGDRSVGANDRLHDDDSFQAGGQRIRWVYGFDIANLFRLLDVSADADGASRRLWRKSNRIATVLRRRQRVAHLTRDRHPSRGSSTGDRERLIHGSESEPHVLGHVNPGLDPEQRLAHLETRQLHEQCVLPGGQVRQCVPSFGVGDRRPLGTGDRHHRTNKEGVRWVGDRAGDAPGRRLTRRCYARRACDRRGLFHAVRDAGRGKCRSVVAEGAQSERDHDRHQSRQRQHRSVPVT
jgi:hypothetical protein